MLDEQQARKQAAQDGVTHFTTGVAVFRSDKLLVVQRAAEDDALGGEWEIPGGGVDEGETIEQGARRELLEETGLVVSEVLGIFPGFDYTTARKPKARQFNFRVHVEPGDVVLDPNEHDDYRWITEADIDALRDDPVMQKCLHDAFTI
jgi:8-oxo-dGTP diphosphatase